MVRESFFYHAPGHSGILGNELPDRIGTHRMLKSLIRITQRSQRTLKKEFHNIIISFWHKFWRIEGQDTILRHWIPSIFKIPDWFPPNKKLVHLLTGHGYFQYYLKRFNITLSHRCLCGTICLDVFHYSNDCPRVKHITQHLYKSNTNSITYNDFPRLLKNKKTLLYLIHLVTLMTTLAHISPPTRIPDAD